MRYAAIDIGTNSCRLLIAEPAGDELRLIKSALESTRIGEGINESDHLKSEAMERTIVCLQKFNNLLEEYKVDKSRVIATSAVREAANREQFEKDVLIRTGLQIDTVDGEAEAKLSYEGVRRGLKLAADPLVVDLGGGSTEFICLAAGVVVSIPLGVVRAAEGDLPAGEMAELLKPVNPLKARLADNPLVMVGGTASTLVAIKEGMAEYDPQLVHGAVLKRTEVGDLYNLLERLPLGVRKRLPGLQPERADIIPKGALITLLIMDMLGKSEIIVSESSNLEGIIWSLADQR